MNMNHEIAFWMYLSLFILQFMLGIVLLVRREFMPYHAAQSHHTNVK